MSDHTSLKLPVCFWRDERRPLRSYICHLIVRNCHLNALWVCTEEGYAQRLQFGGHCVVHLHLCSVDFHVEFEKLGILFFLSLQNMTIVACRASYGLAEECELSVEERRRNTYRMLLSSPAPVPRVAWSCLSFWRPEYHCISCLRCCLIICIWSACTPQNTLPKTNPVDDLREMRVLCSDFRHTAQSMGPVCYHSRIDDWLLWLW